MSLLAEKLIKKWAPLTEHIRSDRKKALTCKLLEQQNRYFSNALNEACGGGTPSAPDSCGADTGIARFKPIAMPLVARVFPELVSNDLVGVQPMFTPVGLAYALRYRYQCAEGGAAANDEAGYNTVHALYSGGMPVSGTSLPTSADFNSDAALRGGGLPSLSTDEGGNNYNPHGGYNTSTGERVDADGFCGLPSPVDNMREMGLSIESQEIVARTRKLKARWSLEAQQDLANMHNVDIEEELTDLLAYEISAEIDAEVKNNIIAISQVGGVLVWDYGVSGAAQAGAADGRWEQEKFRTLYTVMLKASNEIAQATRRGAGNFILASHGVVAALEALEQFAVSSVNTNVATESSGVARVGTIGRFTVYRDMFAVNDYATVGYKGAKDNDAGIIYCPYIPLMFSRAVGQENFQPRIGVMTRYGLTNNLFGAELYYRYIDIRGLANSSLAGS
jgi:hypothetical protein